jgi:ketosteroid isomerase-like protein
MTASTLALLLLSAADPAAALREADAAMDRAVGARDAAAFAALVDEEAVWADPDGLREGRAEVARAWSLFTAPGGPSLRWAPTEAVLSRTGELGYTVGAWRLEQTGADGKVRAADGRYVTVWRRGRDGAFRALFDMGLEPARHGSGAPRTPVRAVSSLTEDVQARIGTWAAPDGRRGAYLTILVRGKSGATSTAVDASVAFAPPKAKP